MEHVKRLVLVPEHMVDQRKKPLVPPVTAQVQEIDSDMQDIIQRQDMPIDAQAKVYEQNLQRYLTFYDKRMNKPLQVNVVKPAVHEEEEKPQREQIEKKPDEIETDILDSVPATMKSRTRQLIEKLKAIKILLVGMNKVKWCLKEQLFQEPTSSENRLGIVREYKTKGIPEGVPKPTTPLTRVQAAKKKKRRDVISSPYKWLN